MGRKIRIFDTTLRDGEQTPGVHLNVAEKVEIARQLARLGVDVIEAGFPVATDGDFQAVRAVAGELSVGWQLSVGRPAVEEMIAGESADGPFVAALARTLRPDIDRAWEAIKEARRPLLHVFIATSPIHMRYKLQKSPAEVLRMAREGVSYARELCPNVEFSAEDATRSEPAFLAEICGIAIEAGATVINIPDTVGYTTPAEMAELIAYLREQLPALARGDVVLSVHCHDDLGLAVANSLAAVQAGATQVECTINGLGERAGNASLEELVMALNTRRDRYGVQVGIDTKQIYRTSRLVSTLTGVPVQPNKAIVGANAFAHESGIHQDGVLKERTTYEIMTPESIGLSSGSRLVLGKHSGRHAFRQRLEELGYRLESDELEKAYQRFTELADRKGELSDEDLTVIVEEENVATIPRTYELDYLQIVTGTSTVPTATVRLRIGGDAGDSDAKTLQESACGDGPVNAAFHAVDRITGLTVSLAHYALNAVTAGKDALGEVTVRIRDNGNQYIGRGSSTDVIEASVRAYLHAINKMVQARKQAAETPVLDTPVLETPVESGAER